MATAVSTFTWVSQETPLKAYLGISSGDLDTQLQLWLEAAAKACDAYCGWYYTDDDDEQVDETPTDPSAEPDIKLGVYEYVAAYMGVAVGVPRGRRNAKTGAIAEAYAGGSQGAVPADVALATAAPHWDDHVYRIRLGGMANR